jgi:hypothetical protein
VVLQIFNEKQATDFSEEDVVLDDTEVDEAEYFITPQRKQDFGWVSIGILMFYMAVHMGYFATVLGRDCKEKIKARCCKPKEKDEFLVKDNHIN